MTTIDAVVFLVAAFATYRISRMVGNSAEEGPFSVLMKIRLKLNIREQNTWWRRGLTCPMCVSVWVGLAIALLLVGLTPAALLYGLAFSGVSVVLTAIAG